MSAYERARRALDSLASLAEERRERIALAIIEIIDAHTGGAGLSQVEFEALDTALQQEGRLGTEEEIEALFKTLLR